MLFEICFLISIWLTFIISLLMKDSKAKISMFSFLMMFSFLLLSYYSFQSIIWASIKTYFDLFKIGLIENYFLLLLSLLSVWIVIYSQYYFNEYLRHWKSLKFYMSLFVLFVTSFIGIIAANETITFLIFWELMSVSSYFLVVWNYQERWVISAGSFYFIITHIWMFFIMLSFLPFIKASWSLYFDKWVWIWAGFSDLVKDFVFFCAVIGFGSKAWLVSLHVWLPRAHPIAPSNISAFMSAFMIKLPVLMLFKVIFLDFGPKIPLHWWCILLAISIATSFFWVFYALIQSNFKKLLAYSSIENIWIVFAWFSIAMIWMSLNSPFLISIWLFASLLHVASHAIFKSLLFLWAWTLIERTWTWDFTLLWWIAKKLPFFAKVMLLFTICIAGLPPLSTFISEFLTFVGLFEWVRNLSDNLSMFFLIWIIFLSLTSILAFVTFWKFFWITFLWEPRSDFKVKSDTDFFENVSFVYFSWLIILLSLVPWIILAYVNKILISLKIIPGESLIANNLFSIKVWEYINLDNSIIFLSFVLVVSVLYVVYEALFKKIRIAESWNCWYFELLSRSQYSAQSLIQPIRKLFSYIYLESVHLKRKQYDWLYSQRFLDFEYDVKETCLFDKYIYEPIIHITKLANHGLRKLQNWNLHAYLFYIFVTIMILLLFLAY